jgi:hypothetical protein
VAIKGLCGFVIITFAKIIGVKYEKQTQAIFNENIPNTGPPAQGVQQDTKQGE